jgi:transmembrane sensor
MKNGMETMSNVTLFTSTRKIKEEACEWVIEIDGDEPPSAKKIAELKAWIARSPAHEAALIDMAGRWNQMDVLTALAVPTENTRPGIVKTFMHAMESVAQYLAAGMLNLLTPKYAVIPVLAILLFMFIPDSRVPSTLPVKGETFATTIGEHRKVVLKDGSLMWLNSNSLAAVKFSAGFRKVYLQKGEAHFEVEKDKSRPFEVYTESEVITAIGTAFSVHRQEGSVEVLVTEGIVELALIKGALSLIPDLFDVTLANNGDPERKNLSQKNSSQQNAKQQREFIASLEAGQSLVVTASAQSVNNIQKHESAELMRQLSWTDGKLIFNGESLQEVVDEISRFTTIKIEMTDPKIQNIRIGGQFNATETDAFFDFIESSFDISVNRLTEDHIVLTSK